MFTPFYRNGKMPPLTQYETRKLLASWVEDVNVSLGLRTAIKSILDRVTHVTPEEERVRQKFLSAARELYGDDELEFDDDAVVVESGEDGHWVQGWKWISNEEAKAEAMLLDPEEHCCQLLYGEDGFVAKCSVAKGIEHDHSDFTAEYAVAQELAVRVWDLQEELNGVTNG